MKKNELIAKLVNRKLTAGAAREVCFVAASRNICFVAPASRNFCFGAVEQRPAQTAPAK
jgi:hypothetical protein